MNNVLLIKIFEQQKKTEINVNVGVMLIMFDNTFLQVWASWFFIKLKRIFLHEMLTLKTNYFNRGGCKEVSIG